MQFLLLPLSVDEGLSLQECSGSSSGIEDSTAGGHTWQLAKIFQTTIHALVEVCSY